MAKCSLTAFVEREGDGFVSLCPELDIASQGKTVEEAAANLREAVELYLECADAQEIKSRLEKDERMATKIEALETKVLELGIEDRARLAEKLILSLDAPEEEENLRLWVAEAEQRLHQLRAGKATEIPARDVFRRARAALT